MRGLEPERLANALLPAVLAAATIEMRHYAAGVAVEEKADASPVTAADREAEAVLLDGLWRAARGVPVIAEESTSLEGAPAAGTAYFVVDPLDGTREFITRTGEFTINIGLVVGNEPAFGIIYAPALGRLFATLGDGRAFEAEVVTGAAPRSFGDLVLMPLATRRSDPQALIVLESRSHRSEALESFLTGYRVAETRRAGSSLKFCLIARGEADLYARLGPTREWDTAAGQAILAAAGGSVTTLDGARLDYRKPDFLNPSFVAWAGQRIPPATI